MDENEKLFDGVLRKLHINKNLIMLKMTLFVMYGGEFPIPVLKKWYTKYYNNFFLIFSNFVFSSFSYCSYAKCWINRRRNCNHLLGIAINYFPCSSCYWYVYSISQKHKLLSLGIIILVGIHRLKLSFINLLWMLA